MFTPSMFNRLNADVGMVGAAGVPVAGAEGALDPAASPAATVTG